MSEDNEIPADEAPEMGAPERESPILEAADLEPVDTTVAEAAAEEADAGEPEEPSEVANTIAKMGLKRMSLQELKDKAPADLLAFAELF